MNSETEIHPRKRFLPSGIFFIAAALLFLSFFSNALAENLSITETDVPIRVDGHLEDWPEARMVELDRADQVVLGKFLWKDADHFSGRVFVCYDSRYLYLAALVQKPSAVVNGNNGSALWNGDCLELFLSTDPKFQDQKKPSLGDYHLGFSPGTHCDNPRVYCFNKDCEVSGARLIARRTQEGYLLEGAVPLDFFKGLQVGKGKTCGLDLALDEGGSFAGNRIVRMDLQGEPSAWEKPAHWSAVSWIGKDEITVPFSSEPDPDAGLVLDGVDSSLFLGLETITGTVKDALGKPLAGARVWSWPKTSETFTGPDGGFVLKDVKTYGNSLIYGKADGYATSLQPASGKKVNLILQRAPFYEISQTREVSSFFYGMVSSGAEGSVSGKVEDSPKKDFHLDLLKLPSSRLAGKTETEGETILDAFAEEAKGLGAEPMVQIPISSIPPSQVAMWVKHCDGETQNKKVRFWSLGNEPDVQGQKDGAPPVPGSYNAYDEINDFRVYYNAMKQADPSIFIAGPELGAKYTEDDDDWLTPFMKYDGDIVDIVSVHRYGASNSKSFDPRKVDDTLRREPVLLQAIEDKISENTLWPPPLVVTDGGLFDGMVSPKDKQEADEESIWSVLWGSMERGMLLENQTGMACFSYGPNTPSFRFFRVLCDFLDGELVPAEAPKSNVSVFAAQNPLTKDVALLLVNRGKDYQPLKMRFDGKPSDVMVSAGLDQQYDYEVPSQSVACVAVKADRSGAQAILYTPKVMKSGADPEVTILKPW